LAGLAAAVRELQLIVQGLKARLPGVPKPARPTERRNGERQEGERLNGADRRPEPRLPLSGPPGIETLNAIPTRLDGPDTQERWRKPEPEWLRRAIIEEVKATSRSAGVTPTSDHRTGEARRPLEASGAASPDNTTPDVDQTTAASSPNMFETVWPSTHRKPEEMPQQRAEASPEIAARPAETKSPAAPAPPMGLVRPARLEPRLLPILKSGVIDEMAYTLFTDGSIEAQMPDGTMRFASIEELRRHLDKNEE
jgi:hypothetical protein